MAQLIDEKKGEKILILDVTGVCNFTDYFVICSGQSRIQLNAIGANIEQSLKEKNGLRPLAREGMKTTSWVVLDYGDVIVHLMNDETRDYYRLEEIWGDAKVIYWPEAAKV